MKIPDHELVARIGQGSYGEVWLARSVMGSLRAAKFIFRKTFREAHPFQRELAGIQKFEPISRSHPGFVHILHAGHDPDDEYSYYLMEVADDIATGQRIDPANYTPKTLSKVIERNGLLPLEQSVQLALRLTNALAYLHEKGLVHRDIKPSNIVFVDGQPKLADIGLVTAVGEAQSYVGTEGFIPPEGPGTAQADIYSLGKVIYEAATGKDRQQFPELPPNLAEFSEREKFLELNEIILKACHHDRAKRYPSAVEMLKELQLFEAGRSILKFRKRERLLASAKQFARSAAGFAILVSLAAYIFTQQHNATVSRRENVRSALAAGTLAMEEGAYIKAIPHFVEALRLEQGDPARESNHRLRIAATLAHCPKLAAFWAIHASVQRAELSPDGRFALILTDSVEVRDVATGEVVVPAFGPKDAIDATFSPDGRLILITGPNGLVSLYDAGGAQIRSFKNPAPVRRARFDSTGALIVTAAADGHARIWKTDTGELERSLHTGASPLLHASFSPDGELLVTTCRDGGALLWNPKTGERIGARIEHAAPINCADFSPDSKRLVTCSDDGTARLWKCPSGEDTAGIMRHESGVRTARYSPDGRFIVTGSHDYKVHLWRASLGLPAANNPTLPNTGRLTSAAFDRSGRRIITSSADGSIRIWDIAERNIVPDLYSCAGIAFDLTVPQKGNFPGAEFLQKAEKIVLSADGSSISVRNWTSSLPVRVEQGRFQINAESRRIAIMRGSDVLVVQGNAEQGLKHPAEVKTIAFSPRGDRLATGAGAAAFLWNLESEQPSVTEYPLPLDVELISFNAKGEMLLACMGAAADKEAPAGDIPPKLNTASTRNQPALSPLIVSNEDHSAVAIDIATQKISPAPFAHNHDVLGSYYSDESQLLLSLSQDHTLRLWDSRFGAPITPNISFAQKYTALAFLPRERIAVATEGDASQAWVWRFPFVTHSVEELQLLVALFSDAKSRSTAELAAAWKTLYAKHPADFR